MKSNHSRTILALGTLAVLALPALAQERPKIQTVVIYRVKSDRNGDFQAAIKEYNALMKHGGSDRYRTVWLSQSGPREYALVRYFNKWADLDAAPDPKLKDDQAQASRILTRMIECTESTSRIISEILPDLSLESSGDTPKMVRVMRTVVKPDRVDDYMALVKSEVLPAAKKGGARSYALERTRYGGPTSEFRSVLGIESWADMDQTGPVLKGMGEDAFKKFVTKIGSMVQESEITMYRYMPDLSYVPEKTMTTADRQK